MIARRALAAACLAAAGAGCISAAGILSGPEGYVRPATLPCPSGQEAVCFAPVLYQEIELGPSERFDRPVRLDADGSGRLDDDFRFLRADEPPVYYAGVSQDAERTYVFYAFYYPIDWSGDPENPAIDHRGDLEGALVIASRATGQIDAVITQAHRLFYVWLPSTDPPTQPGVSGTVPLAASGNPILFSERGAHGVYSFGSGPWTPRGGRTYPTGPAGVSPRRLQVIEPPRPYPVVLSAELRPLEELRRYMDGDGRFRDLPPGATPPWRWGDRRGGDIGELGLILSKPSTLLDRLVRTPRP